MYINKIMSTLTFHKHICIEILLFLIIVFLLFRTTINTNVYYQDTGRNTVLTFSLMPDGVLVVSEPNVGNVVTVPREKLINRGQPVNLGEIGFAITEYKSDDKTDHHDLVGGLLDKIISPAMATKHNLPGHIYWNYSWTIGSKKGCTRYDVTKYPPTLINVGACI
ncbi:MAG: hypothetical protein IPN42_13105 [Methylococcaceae bacterium]|nr:hypothetical protein [Methylococcaceae bacterium]